MGHSCDTAMYLFFLSFFKRRKKKSGIFDQVAAGLGPSLSWFGCCSSTTALWWSSLVLVSTHQNWYHWCLSRHIGIALAASVLALAHWLSLFVVMLPLFCLFLISFLIYFCLGKVQELEASSNWVTACWSFA